jgi:hypothetical protein
MFSICNELEESLVEIIYLCVLEESLVKIIYLCVCYPFRIPTMR